MFTGLIEDVGTVQSIRSHGRSVSLAIKSAVIASDLAVGDSVSVNGACLTATAISNDGFTADAVPETMRRTTLGSLKAGDAVNLERAMKLGSRFGGHIVSGHVDGLGRIRMITREELARVYTVECSSELTRYIVEKGSITVDGVSLTVMDVSDISFRFSLIPHSADQTTLGNKRVGDSVNLETDILAKYVEKLLKPASANGVTLDLLRENGFL